MKDGFILHGFVYVVSGQLRSTEKWERVWKMEEEL